MPRYLDFDPALREMQARAARGAPGEGLPTLEDRVPVLARLTDDTGLPDGLEVISRFGDVVTARAEIARLHEIRSHPCIASLKASRAYGPCQVSSVRDARTSTRRRLSRADDLPTGRGVIVAVIDWGCDFAHANFRDEAGNSRLLAIWDQRPERTSASPRPQGYGRVIERAEIDAALRAADPYAALGYDPRDVDLDNHGTHGTHVLDIAAGSGRAPGAIPGVAPEADLLFVHLRGDDTRPEENLGDSVRLLEAVDWVFQRAGATPVVINMSLGRTGGPHDGTTLVERALDAALRVRAGRAIVMSTGNYYDSRMHSHGRVAPGGTAELRFEMPTMGTTPMEMEIWYSGGDEFDVEILDPDGALLAQVRLGQQTSVSRAGQTVATVYHRRRDPNNGDNLIDLLLWRGAPSGVWTVRVHGLVVHTGSYHAWIERVAPRRQARFTHGSATRTSTTNTVCNGHETIAVGAYHGARASFPMAVFSSSGPTRDGRRKPNIVAPGAGITAARSVSTSGAGTDLLVEKSGTSMAAPHVTGAVALLFQAALPLRLRIGETRAALFGSARVMPPELRADEVRTGAGQVDAAAAVAAVRRYRERVRRNPSWAAYQRLREPRVALETRTERVLEWLRGGGS